MREEVEETFNRIYRDELWGGGSGPGSRKENSIEYLRFINEFISRNQVISILDIGVGDGELLSHLNLEGRSYTGIDVSSEAISIAREKNYKNEIQLCIADAEFFDFQQYDLILCKDVLQHLPNDKALRIINLMRRNSKFTIICNDFEYSDEKINSDIELGGYRTMNLAREPFCQRGKIVLQWDSAGFTKRVLLFTNSSFMTRVGRRLRESITRLKVKISN